MCKCYKCISSKNKVTFGQPLTEKYAFCSHNNAVNQLNLELLQVNECHSGATVKKTIKT